MFFSTGCHFVTSSLDTDDLPVEIMDVLCCSELTAPNVPFAAGLAVAEGTDVCLSSSSSIIAMMSIAENFDFPVTVKEK